MTQLMGAFDRLANNLNCAVVFAAHFPKGNLSKRTAMDRISGSGVFARDPDAIITLSELTKAEGKGAKTKDKVKSKEEFEPKLCEMLEILRDSEDGLSKKDWIDKASGSLFNIDRNNFNRRFKKLEELSYIAAGSEVYSAAEAGLEYLERYEESKAANLADADLDSEEEKINEEAIMKMDFTLRAFAPQNSIAVRFEYPIHMRTSTKGLKESDDKDDAEGSVILKCKVDYETKNGKDWVIATCCGCGESAESIHEVRKPADSARKRSLAILSKVCKCPGESKFFVEDDSGE